MRKFFLLIILCTTTTLIALPLKPKNIMTVGETRLEPQAQLEIKKNDLSPKAQIVLVQTLQDDIQITEKMKNEFWAELSAYGPFTYSKRELIRDKLVGAEVILTSYLYRDIMISIYLGEPYKSDLREGYQNRLMQLHVINEITIKEFDKLVTKMIESEKSEKVPENQPKKTRQGLLQLITKATLREKRINQLFGIDKITHIEYPKPAPLLNESQSTLLDIKGDE